MYNRLVFLDTETTGTEVSEGHRIVEIACIDVIGRDITDRTFHAYINPERDIHPDATVIHGIDNTMIEDKPKFADILEQLLDYVRDAEVVAHNAAFDIGFINGEINLANSKKGTSYPMIDHVCGQVTDTLALAKKRYPGLRNSLKSLCHRLEVDDSERTFHGALLDASLLAQVWLKLTGGQKVLDLKAASLEPLLAGVPRDINKPLPIIQATKEELKRHNEYMQSLEALARKKK